MRYAVVDLETTGGSADYHKITEVAIFLVEDGKVIDEFSSLVNPERKIPYFITQLTGITDEMVRNAPKFPEVARKIVEMTEGATFVAHNVSFDYGILRSEFKQLGYDFNRKKLCTVKLSRKLLKGHRSYSLGKLCTALGIPLTNAHRAKDDAYATVELLRILMKETGDAPLNDHGVRASQLPPDLDPKVLEELPDETGVYYFYNKEGDLVYVGKSINIRNRVFEHLANHKTRKAIDMAKSIAEIQFEITGSELVALLLESDEIKRHQPIYNRAQRKTAHQFGLVVQPDLQGYLTLKLEKANKHGAPLTAFSSIAEGKEFLFKFVEKHGLCQKLSGLYTHEGSCFQYKIKQCLGACVGEESADDYNKRIQKALKDLTYVRANFFIIDKGRSEDEKSAILIENRQYRGFGYFDSKQCTDKESVKDCIKFYKDNRDVQKIIRLALKEKKFEQIL